MFSNPFPAIGEFCQSIFNYLGHSRHWVCCSSTSLSQMSIRMYLPSPVGTESKYNTGLTETGVAALCYQWREESISWIPHLVRPHLGAEGDWHE